jgi:hypothetical protein
LPVTLIPKTKRDFGDIFSQNKCDIRIFAWDKTLKKLPPKILYIVSGRGGGELGRWGDGEMGEKVLSKFVTKLLRSLIEYKH